MSRFILRGRALARDDRGTSVVELALFAPFLGTLMLGMIDVGQGLSARHDLQQAASYTMQLALAREALIDASGNPDYTFLNKAAASAAGVPLANVTVSRWVECERVAQATFDATCADDEEMARYVRVRITTTYRPSFRYGPVALSSAASADGTVPMAAEASLRIQ